VTPQAAEDQIDDKYCRWQRKRDLRAAAGQLIECRAGEERVRGNGNEVAEDDDGDRASMDLPLRGHVYASWMRRLTGVARVDGRFTQPIRCCTRSSNTDVLSS